MKQKSDPAEVDQQYFDALLAGDVKALEGIMGKDFLMIDVFSGNLVEPETFMGAVRSGQLKFNSIQPAERHARTYPGAAVVTGRTKMAGQYAGTNFTIRSRYTHVFVEQSGKWRMVSAQGTPIAGEGR